MCPNAAQVNRLARQTSSGLLQSLKPLFSAGFATSCCDCNLRCDPVKHLSSEMDTNHSLQTGQTFETGLNQLHERGVLLLIMFSKLQLYILAICTLAAAGVWGFWEYHQLHLPRQFISVPNDSSSSSDDSQDQSSSDDTFHKFPSTNSPKPPPQPESDEDKAADKIIDSITDKIGNCFKTEDYSFIVDNMYAPVVDKFGGKEKVMEACQAAVAELKAQQMDVITWHAVKPYSYYNGNFKKYAVVPYEMEMNYNGKKIKQTGYQLGIKTPDANWQFVNGDRLSPEIFQEFFPDFPSNVELPEMQQGYE